MRVNLQNAVNQDVAYHKVTDQVASALPYGNVNNQDSAQGYYDVNNEPLLGTHTLRMGMQEVHKISPYFCAPKCVPA